MSIFVAEDLVEVEVSYAQLGPSDVAIIRRKEEEEFYAGKVKIKKLKAKFARPGWKLFNDYMDETLSEDNDDMPTLNTVRLRRNKFRVLIEYLEDDGVVIPLNPGLEDKILPEIPIALIEEYDRVLNEERASILVESGILTIKKEEKEGEENKDDAEEVAEVAEVTEVKEGEDPSAE